MSSGEPDSEYRIVFARSARKELEKLPRAVIARIMTRIEALALNPRPAGSRKLVGSENMWRIRVGDYRVIYEIYDEQRIVDIAAVRHRRDAYK